MNTQENIYILSILKEIQNYAILMTGKPQPNSIQFGGGTPSAMSTEGLIKLLDGLSKSLDMSNCSEIKFEFHPDMHLNLEDYRAKLKVLKKFGLTTAIIDIEATNDKVLKSICRGNTSTKTYLDLIRIAKEEGVESIASAFMIGLPHERLETFEETLNFLSSIDELEAINIYPLMFKPSDIVFQQRRRKPEVFATPREKDLMAIMADQILSKAGFKEGPSHFFTRKNHKPTQQLSKARSQTLLGLGPASFGYMDFRVSGLQYMNHPNLQRYSDAVMAGQVGQWRHSMLNKGQVSLRKLIFSLNSLESIDESIVKSANLLFEDNRLLKVIETMINLDLLERDNGKLLLTKKGYLRNSELIYFLCEPHVMKWDTEDPEYDQIRRYEFFPNISKDNESLFYKHINNEEKRLA